MMIQPPDDDERTNSMGLFNTAEAFRLSAMALEDEKVKIGHAASPIRLGGHAMNPEDICELPMMRADRTQKSASI